MSISRGERRDLYVAKVRADLASLAARGLITSGNAFSSVVFVKGLPNEAERTGAALLSGEDGKALRAALGALGYAPEDWCAVASCDAEGAPLGTALLREAVCALDPATLLACDEPAAQALREAYATELAAQEDFDAAMLTPGQVVRILGMRVIALGGFEAALADPRAKQVMWARLKQVPPLGEPY